jgi:hypothetical protein
MPETVSVVSLVTKSLDEAPLSVAIAVIATAAVGANMSIDITVTEIGVELELALPAASVSLAVTSNVPKPCAAIVPAGTVTVALLPEMSPARRV